MITFEPETKILVSCIMPTHNRRAFVPQAIAYFQRQDYALRELIIVDDGTDAIKDLVPQDQRIRYFRQNRRSPLGAKRNHTCEEARGEIIIHWDDDDWMAPGRISYQVQSLLRARADVCGLDRLLFVDPHAGHAWQYVYPKGNTPWVAGGTLCYTKAFWKRNPFPELNVGEDTRFVWSNHPKKLLALPEYDFYVALLHPHNTSSKWMRDKRWHAYLTAEIRKLMGEDWAFYSHFGKH